MAKSRKSKQPPKTTKSRRSLKGSGDAIKAPAKPQSRKKESSEKTIKCSVCLDSSRCRKMKTLDCKHKFHVRCVDKWLKDNDCCPLCRAPTKDKNQPERSDGEDNSQRSAVFDPNVLLFILTLLSS